ncbi:MAG TPA: VWA domain-containing protein [Bryobacteraceae bacterium]|nr:VWA domain-containing protein [Bryobacteraceae bacterium]
MIILAALTSAALLFPQDVFRSDVNLVNVSFVVQDPKGALVKTLSQEDFQVLEDGVPQKISFFARSLDVPLTLGLVVDASGSQSEFVKKHKRDLRDFLKTTIGPQDRVFLLCFGNNLRLVSDLTASADTIIKNFDRFEDGDRDFPMVGPRERRFLGTAFYDAIYHSVAGRLRLAEGGRKALLVFSDGEDNSSAHNMMEAIEVAQEQNVPLFSLRYTKVEGDDLNARNKYGISVMDRIALETGGAHFDAAKGRLAQQFSQISEQLRSAYELAYHSSFPRDGSFRKIRIRPKEAGLVVRAKTGYYSRGDTPEKMRGEKDLAPSSGNLR